ncbi:stage II sporulation protein, partial [Rhodococcus sp. 7Tela_A2]
MAPQSIGRRGKIRRRRFVIGRPLRNGWQPSVARLAVIGLAPALVVGTGVGVLVQNRSDSVGVVEAVSADTPYTFSGFGHGHGRGMGQW